MHCPPTYVMIYTYLQVAMQAKRAQLLVLLNSLSVLTPYGQKLKMQSACDLLICMKQLASTNGRYYCMLLTDPGLTQAEAVEETTYKQLQQHRTTA